jgi:hypothetical protein
MYVDPTVTLNYTKNSAVIQESEGLIGCICSLRKKRVPVF